MHWMIASLLALAPLTVPFDDRDYPKLSPFEAIRWVETTPEVQLEDTWYELIEVNGIEARVLVTGAQERHGSRWQKRIEEDLVQILMEQGDEPEGLADLTLTRLADGQHVVLEDVPMTQANRRAIWSAAIGRSNDRHRPTPQAVSRVEREHATQPHPDFEFLLQGTDVPDARTVSRAAAEQDLDQLEWWIQERYSYAKLRSVDCQAALDTLRVSLKEEVPVRSFGLQLVKFLALFGDGHTRVRGGSSLSVDGALPFLPEWVDGQVVAMNGDRSGPLDPKRPYVEAIDGVPIESWLEAAKAYSSRGHELHETRRAVRMLRYINQLRLELGLELADELVISLKGKRGKAEELSLPVAARRAIYGSWPRGQHGLLDGKIGYLRVPSMDDEREVLAAIDTHMQQFLGQAKGLVIDVRGNGGGSRDILRTIMPYLMDPAGGARVVNVAACRIEQSSDPDRAGGYLDNRALYPAAWGGWSEAAQVAIADMAATFKPDWQPDPAEFSAWHYMVVEPRQDGAYFQGRVVVLHDTDGFSATDVFLGALETLPQVTLMGTTSGGGSGRARGIDLANSGLSVRFSSMASFRPTGAHYDGLGVEPDVVHEASLDDLCGRTDSGLEAAAKLAKKRP